MRSSGWQYNRRYRELEASKWRGIAIPSEFDALDKDDQLDILSHYEIDWRIRAINDYQQAEEAKRNSQRKRKK